MSELASTYPYGQNTVDTLVSTNALIVLVFSELKQGAKAAACYEFSDNLHKVFVSCDD